MINENSILNMCILQRRNILIANKKNPFKNKNKVIV